MKKIPYQWILEWSKAHSGDVLRIWIPETIQEKMDTKPHTICTPVFAKLINDKIYVAKEKDIYDNNLHQFYNEIYKLGDKIETKENYIYCYIYNEYYRNIEFYGFGDKRHFLDCQDMPWFSEDQMNRMIFLNKIYNKEI